MITKEDERETIKRRIECSFSSNVRGDMKMRHLRDAAASGELEKGFYNSSIVTLAQV
jgi:hypothetical protein